MYIETQYTDDYHETLETKLIVNEQSDKTKLSKTDNIEKHRIKNDIHVYTDAWYFTRKRNIYFQ